MAIQKSRKYKDITLDFVPNPVTGDLNVLKNERAITRAVRNLVQTGLKERFYNEIGSDVTNSLFGFVDVASGSLIAKQIQTLLIAYEPRIDKILVQAVAKPDDNAFEITVSYEIVGEPFSANQFSFFLEATR